MKLASWNVNSLKVRLPQVLAWLQQQTPDVLGLQETKLPDDRFPSEALREAGYHAVFSGQPTYNGVALLARTAPEDVVTDPEGIEDEQRRIIAATVDGVRIINLYVVNGKAVGSDKYDYKLDWLTRVTRWIGAEMQHHSRVAVMGDFNIAPGDADVHDPEAWHERILCSTPEREALQKIMELGLTDSLRLFPREQPVFSWWDYRQAAFRRNLGLRIDLILLSPALARVCAASYIDAGPRAWERPSDHAPAVVERESPGG